MKSSKQKEKERVQPPEAKAPAEGLKLSWPAQWLLPVIGLALFGLLAAGIQSDSVEHPWIVGDMLIDSSRKVADPAIKKELREKGGAIVREQIKLHPYHARVWNMYGHYLSEKQDWDSCIFVSRKALELGHGTKVNSIEEIVNALLEFSLNQKLLPHYHNLDSSMAIIQNAEVPGYRNYHLDKLRAYVYINTGDPNKGLPLMQAYVAHFPKDADGLCGLATLQLQLGLQADALQSFKKAQSLDPNHPKVKETASYFMNQ